jgi:hypothetical protein
MNATMEVASTEPLQARIGARVVAFDGKQIGQLTGRRGELLRIRRTGNAYNIPDILVREVRRDEVVLHVDSRTLSGYLRREDDAPQHRLLDALRSVRGRVGFGVAGGVIALASVVGLGSLSFDSHPVDVRHTAAYQQHIVPERIELSPGNIVSTGVDFSHAQKMGAVGRVPSS